MASTVPPRDWTMIHWTDVAPGDAARWIAVLPLAASMPGQISSTAQDLALRRPTEIDSLNGFVVRRGQALGVPTPVNRVCWQLVQAIATR